MRERNVCLMLRKDLINLQNRMSCCSTIINLIPLTNQHCFTILNLLGIWSILKNMIIREYWNYLNSNFLKKKGFKFEATFHLFFAYPVFISQSQYISYSLKPWAKCLRNLLGSHYKNLVKNKMYGFSGGIW